MYEKKSELGALIRELLKKNSLSMRKLSALSGIDTATISRIVNGKQRANMKHIQSFAKYLNVPMEKLLIADGYDIDILKQELLKFSNLLDYNYDLCKIEDELEKYKKYAATKEGKNIIYKNFKEKIDAVNGSGLFVDELKQMYEKFCNDTSSEEIRVLLGSGLLYFILSVDIIPDYVFPLGYLDDVIAIKLVLHHIAEVNARNEKLLQK
ncbi:helix-turn-helix domain-containing protein [Clostridium luticellarii]|uniref:Helix-turn-helix protein n=1 Tax=Clostridium luticellarii TaxID=1691940 RepID=A0A2T0BPL1_9CLOT|nr:helix-turn-helix domain-containing protein [Clostridium luticellarii]MCI1944196.1 helix-turn-helix domain-containing protein [Clostridium luticellarii]MCI1967698.1 helix-turn-helix domain-containing protein [Clostridium luticellarii]MCI1994853.1 helix-turn-helix domain-containing protein [Clostridium luticellarii]MCI2039662.1 helix-turn-helix domain-containing protein [Clostridium luticellarii]PRR85809.1 helix-turn-helix protein [Clostridium luticellarii]